MKFLVKSFLVLCLFTSLPSFAIEVDNFADNGVYIVGQAGIGRVEAGFLDNFLGSTKFTSNSGFSARIGAGYQLNRYLGLEGGIAAYPSAIRDFDSSRGLHLGTPTTRSVGQSDINGIYSVDMMGMARMPIGNYFFVGAGVGVAAMHFSYSSMQVTNPTSSSPNWDAGSANFIAPKAELRLGSKINSKTAVYFSASHIFSANGSNPEIRNYQPALDMFAIGINYNL